MIVREHTVRPRFGRSMGIVIFSGLAFALASCGGGGGDDPAPQPQPQPSPLPSPPTVPPLSSPPQVKLQSQDVGTVRQWPQSGDTSTGGQGAPVDGFTCGVAVETFHVHSHLSIFLNGDQLIVPDHVGIPTPPGGTECTYAVHTHDGSGVIHIEAPAAGSFTLGNFFHIWGRPLDRTNIGGISGLPITVYIVDEGQTAATEYTGDLLTIDLPAHRQITIQIGTAIKVIPVYDFDGA